MVTTFVPDFDEGRDADVQQEILQPEAVTSQQHWKQDRQIVVDRIVLRLQKIKWSIWNLKISIKIMHPSDILDLYFHDCKAFLN